MKSQLMYVWHSSAGSRKSVRAMAAISGNGIERKRHENIS